MAKGYEQATYDILWAIDAKVRVRVRVRVKFRV